MYAVSGADFSVTNRNIQPQPNSPTPVQVFLRVDSIAQELDETFQLKLRPRSGDSMAKGENEFVEAILNLTILDQDCKSVLVEVSCMGNLLACTSLQL